ncbi:MAG: tetratricopeptide repeat protein, partial [Calditrichaeota bacterium]
TRLGQRYTLTAEVLDPATGEMLASEIVHADSREKVLDALDELTRRIRRHLGEAMAAISRRSRPLKHVTTASLEALKYYSVADEHLRRAEYEEARRFLESALKVDSSFTAAKAVLGRMHFELSEYVEGFDREVGKRLLAEAVKDVDNLTDQEKYGILAWYAQAVENDLPRAIQYTKELATLYPDQSHVHNNLAFLYGQMGRYQEAIRECQTAIRLDPYLMIAYNNLSNIYMFQLGSEIDSARVWCLRQIAHNPEHFWAYYHLGWAYLGMDSLKQAQQALEKAYELHNRWKILPRFTWHLSRLGVVYLLQGDYRRSIDFFLKIVEVNPSEPAGYYFAGVAAEVSGDTLSARQYFRQFVREMRQLLRRGPVGPEQQIYLALGLIRIGEREQGWKLCQQACARDTTLHFEKARVLAVYGKPQEAIDELEAAVRHGYRNYVWMKIHPDFLSLHREPRFIALVNRLLKRGQDAS